MDPMEPPTINPFAACLSPKMGDAAPVAPPVGASPPPTAAPHGKRVAFEDNGRLDSRLHPAPYPPAGPRTPRAPATPLVQSLSEFFTLDNMEKVLNCVPLVVDPRSPNSRGAGAGSTGVGGIFFGDGPTSQEKAEGRPEAREDGPQIEGAQFTPRERAEFAFVAEREAAMTGDFNDHPEEVVAKEHDPGTLLQRVQRTAWKLQSSLPSAMEALSPRSCLGDAAAATEGGGPEEVLTPRASNHNGTPPPPPPLSAPPKASGHRRGSSSGVPAAVFFEGGSLDGVPSAVSGAPFADGATSAATPHPAWSSSPIPGGLWSLASDERSDSGEDAKNGHLGGGEDAVLRMRSPPAAGGADPHWTKDGDGASSDSSDGPSLDLNLRAPAPTATAPATAPSTAPPIEPLVPLANPAILPAAQHAILAAQRAVRKAVLQSSPPATPADGRAHGDKYWMEDEVKETLRGVMMRECDALTEGMAEASNGGQTGRGGAVEALREVEGEGEAGYDAEEVAEALQLTREDLAMLEDEEGLGGNAPSPEEAPRPSAEVDAEEDLGKRSAEAIDAFGNEAFPHDAGAAPSKARDDADDDEPYAQGCAAGTHPYATDAEANARFDAAMAAFELRPRRRGGAQEEEVRIFGFPKPQRRKTPHPPPSPLMAKAAARRKKQSKQSKSQAADEASSNASKSSAGEASRASFLAGTMGRKLNRRPRVVVEGEMDESTMGGSTDRTGAEDEGVSLGESLGESAASHGSLLHRADAAVTGAATAASKKAAENVAGGGDDAVLDEETKGPDATDAYVVRRPTVKPQEATEGCPEDEKMDAGDGPDDEAAMQEGPLAGESEESEGSKEEEAAPVRGDRGLDGIVGSLHGSSFDSSVNWDVLAYSLSDNGSTNSEGAAVPSTKPEAGLVTAADPKPAADAIGSVEDVGIGASPTRSTLPPSARPPKQVKQQVTNDAPLDVAEAVTKGVSAMHAPSKHSRTPPSPEQHVTFHQERHQVNANPKNTESSVGENITPRAWERIERLKKQHDEEVGKIRNMVRSTKDADGVGKPVPLTTLPLKQTDLTIHTPSDEENMPIFSPNTPIATTDRVKQRLDAMRKQHERDIEQVQAAFSPASRDMTPRTNARVKREVQSRIDEMRDQHKRNMERMRHALEDVREGVISDAPETPTSSASPRRKEERHIAESVRTFKTNATRFEKARARYASHRATYSPSPKQQPGNRFNFDEASPRVASPRIASPRIASPRATSSKMQELMSKHVELEEEMRQIRLLSPKKPTTEAWKPLSPVREVSTAARPRLHDAFTPSSARYTSPSNYDLMSPSLSVSSPRLQNLHDMISTETQMNTRITGLIADVKNFLEENDRAQERLTEDLEL